MGARVKLPGYTPLAICTLLYVWQTGEYIMKREYPNAIIFAAYAAANCGFIWDFIRRIG